MRFLNAREKLLGLALLNTKWKIFLKHHYAWFSLPQRGPLCLTTEYIKFFDTFNDLTGLEIPDFPGQFLTEPRIKLLMSARFIGIRGVEDIKKFSLIC